MPNNDLNSLIKETLLQLVASQRKCVTVEAWIDTYELILAQRNYSVQTLKNKATYLKHLKKHFGNRAMDSITPFEISTAFLEYSPSTSKRLIGAFKDVYYEAVANGEANANPLMLLRSPKVHTTRKRLDIDTFNKMLEVSFDIKIPWVTNMLLLALGTGQRRGDLANMCFTDIVDGHLRVEQQKKAGKPQGARLAIPLSINVPSIGCTLADIIELCRKGPEGPNLLRKSNGTGLDPSSLSYRFRTILDMVCGAEAYKKYEHPSLHEVRSMSARHYLLDGMPRETIQTLMGHKDEEMTNVYLDDRGLTSDQYKIVLA